jgi:hypothetical protein
MKTFGSSKVFESLIWMVFDFGSFKKVGAKSFAIFKFRKIKKTKV